jgi:hypothetical protein
MEVHGEVGALGSLLGHKGGGCERILRGVGGSFQVILDLRWEMAPRLDFDMIYGVGILSLRKPFWIYLVLHAQKTLLLWITWKFLEVPFSGT